MGIDYISIGNRIKEFRISKGWTQATLDEIAYGSLIKSSHVSVKMIDEILADCSSEELKSLAEVIRTTKIVLRNK